MRNAELRSFLREARSRCPELTILENEPMSRHCSFRIGGPCDAMLLPSSVSEIETVCALLAEAGEKPLLIGNGTNLLVSDAPLHRIVLRLGEEFSRIEPVGDTALRAESVTPRLPRRARSPGWNLLTASPARSAARYP